MGTHFFKQSIRWKMTLVKGIRNAAVVVCVVNVALLLFATVGFAMMHSNKQKSSDDALFKPALTIGALAICLAGILASFLFGLVGVIRVNWVLLALFAVQLFVEAIAFVVAGILLHGSSIVSWVGICQQVCGNVVGVGACNVDQCAWSISSTALAGGLIAGALFGGVFVSIVVDQIRLIRNAIDDGYIEI